MRFVPDSWLAMLLRPITMAAADANAYVEIMAPDFRFALILLLVLLLGRLAWRRRGDAAAAASRPVWVLLAALAVAFVPWLATSGNGRYFLAGLVVAGPVCVGLARLLPATRAMRLTIVAGMVALQAFAVQQSSPWHAWTLVHWKDAPAFAVDIPADEVTQPGTYVTLSAISYSLLAPRFHPASHWISLHNAPPPGSGAPDAARTQAFLAAADPAHLMLLVPVVAGMLTADRLPNPAVSQALEAQLAPYRLAFSRPEACRFLAAPAMADMSLGVPSVEDRAHAGFWLCRLVHLRAGGAPETARPLQHDAVFRALEKQCPALFPYGGDKGSQALANGEMRSYLQAEMKAYVYDTGDVFYKYYRALDPVRVGTVQDVLAGRARVDCSGIRGRAALPWDREI